MVTIVKQTRFSFGRFREIYQFPLPSSCRKPVEEILAFFQTRPLRDIVAKRDSLQFSRGTVFSSIFNPSECRQKQDVFIQMIGRTVNCEFHCLPPIAHIQIPPSRLYKEVQALEAFLVNSSRKSAKRKRIFGSPIYRLIYLVYRLFSGARYRAQRRLTNAGWMVLIGIFAALLMGADTENTVIYQGLSILIFLLLIALAASWSFRARFAATRLLPRFGSVGRTFRYRVIVKNLTPKTQSDLTLLENLPDPRPRFQQWKAMQLADEKRIRPFRFSSRRANPYQVATAKEAVVPTVPPSGQVEVRVELEPLRRGVLRFEGVTVARPDPFGLFRAFVKVPVSQTAVILPKRYPVPPVALPGSMKYQEGGIAMASSVGRSDEFVSLREYRRGDPYRHIHWRSWAKTGKPIVKEFEDEFFVRHALILDTFTDDPRSDAFEEAVSVAASFACTLITQESLLDLLFVGPQAYCFTAGRGLAHADQMLEILASVQVCPDQPFEKLEHLVLEHAGAVSGCICVLLDWDDSRRKLVGKLRALGVPTMALLVLEPGCKPSMDPAAEPFGDIHQLEAGKIEQGLAEL